jgi:hypothetical protein
VGEPVANLIGEADLPEGFVYPASFVRVVGLGLVELEPWQVLSGELLYWRYRGLGGAVSGAGSGSVRAASGLCWSGVRAEGDAAFVLRVVAAGGGGPY